MDDKINVQENVEVDIPTFESEDDELAYIRTKRLSIVNKLTKNGNHLSEDPDERKLVRDLLGDLDKSALGRKRIKADEKIGSQHAEATAIIADILNSNAIISMGKNLVPVKRELPVLPASVPDPVLVPGELDSAPPQQTYEGFMAIMANKQ